MRTRIPEFEVAEHKRVPGEGENSPRPREDFLGQQEQKLGGRELCEQKSGGA